MITYSFKKGLTELICGFLFTVFGTAQPAFAATAIDELVVTATRKSGGGSKVEVE